MGTSRSAHELATKLQRAGREINGRSARSVNASARVVEDVFYREAAKSIGGPKIAGKPWRTKSRPAKSATNPQALVFYQGPVHWFDKGTRPHTIVTKKLGGSRESRGAVEIPGRPWRGMFAGARRRGAIRTPMGFRAYARHPGMKARPFWRRTKDASRGVARDAYRRHGVTDALRGAGFR